MLSCLRVRSLAVIDALEVDFHPGLNVVTGETGAGKSVLVRALELVLGARGRAELVRGGADRAEVEALFEGPGLAPRLEALGLEVEDQIVVRRTLFASGRSRATVNGRLATNAQLATLCAGLVDISSQHQHHSLADVASHLPILDAYAHLEADRARVAEAYARAAEALTTLREARSRLADRGERERILGFQLAEVEQVAPEPGEDEALHAEQLRLAHASELASAALGAEHALTGADRAVVNQLGQLTARLERAAVHDGRLTAWATQIRSASLELEDAAIELGRYGHDLEADPARLAAVEERLAALRRVVRRYGPTLDDVLAFAETAREELARLDSLEGEVARAEKAFAAQRDAAARLARALSVRRRAAGDQLATALAVELQALGMGGARVIIEVAPLEGHDPELQDQGASLSATGIDRVAFHIAPNPGTEPLPLGQIASGGELSRALLGLKRVLSGLGSKGLYVFDEVDTGVGGGIAEIIGRKIAEVARHHQVLCITHLPQIAAFAEQHVHVRKEIEADSTRSRAEVLSPDERLEELARMLGGVRITSATRATAAEMLNAAEEHRRAG